ncbi:MAG: DUF4870 domain-containing protein [Pyrinomonadaceae bacterium]
MKNDRQKNDRQYDTDPLDPEFAKHTEQMFSETRPLGQAQTQSPRPDAPLEEQTRRFSDQPSAPYPSVFAPPSAYQPPTINSMPPLERGYVGPNDATLTKRPVQKLGLPENIASSLAYAPFFIGLIISLVELLLLPRTEARTRAHASQALGIHFVVLAAGLVFKLARFLAGIALGGFALTMLGIISGIFSLAATILLIVSMVRVWKGKDVRYDPLTDLAKWINKHLEPIK